MGARPGTGLGQPQWLQTSPKDPPVGKKNQVWQRACLVSSSDLQRPAPQGPVPLPPTELEARRRLRPRAHGVRSGFALPAPAGGVSCCASHPSLPGRVWVALEVRSADPPGGPRRPCPGPAAASAWHGSGGGRAAAVGVCVSPAACLWPWAVAAPPRRAQPRWTLTVTAPSCLCWAAAVSVHTPARLGTLPPRLPQSEAGVRLRGAGCVPGHTHAARGQPVAEQRGRPSAPRCRVAWAGRFLLGASAAPSAHRAGGSHVDVASRGLPAARPERGEPPPPRGPPR